VLDSVGGESRGDGLLHALVVDGYPASQTPPVLGSSRKILFFFQFSFATISSSIEMTKSRWRARGDGTCLL